MSAPVLETGEPLLQVVGPTDSWILERLARKLAAKLPYARFVPWNLQPSPVTRIVYFINYALYHRPSGLIDVAFFTHRDDAQHFLERARRMHYCISMSKQYADWLRTHGVTAVVHIPMGFDFYHYRPRLVLGVVGRLEHPRKGVHLVERLKQLPFVELLTTDGQFSENHLSDFYQRIDYVLIPATVEGGPMSLLEGLAMGKPIIAPATVGMVPEFGDTPSIRRYPTGNAEALVQLATDCYQEKLQRNRLVNERTWDRWAEAHDALFRKLLQQRGLPAPQPAPGFRFGMLGELEIPLGIQVDRLESALDRAAAHLYYGQYPQARAVLEALTTEFPFAEKLLGTIPPPEAAVARCPSTKKLSLIVNVLESYPVVRRQLRHLDRILTPDCELILVDDGSSPSLRETCDSVPKSFDFKLHCTNDRRPWTQPRARNIGASLASAPKLLFFDIDQILTKEVIDICLGYQGDKLHWLRRAGILDEEGRITTDRQVLLDHGLKKDAPSLHLNSFMIRRELFDRLEGYDERFCGCYGGEDIEFNVRYEKLCQQGQAQPAVVRGEGYYYPDPARVTEQFHSLQRIVGALPSPTETNCQVPGPDRTAAHASLQ